MKSPEPALAAVRVHPAFVIFGTLLISRIGRPIGLLDTASDSGTLVHLLPDVGRALIGIGALMLLFAYGAMAAARTTIDPRRHTRTIVTSGIYRFSRNPIYIGWFFLILGVGVNYRSLFQMAVAVAMIVVLRWAVVLPEEAYLERTFGDEYRDYKRRVRRWM